jgi:hypothetical protein
LKIVRGTVCRLCNFSEFKRFSAQTRKENRCGTFSGEEPEKRNRKRRRKRMGKKKYRVENAKRPCREKKRCAESRRELKLRRKEGKSQTKRGKWTIWWL